MSRLIDFLTMFRYFTFPYLYGFFFNVINVFVVEEKCD